MVLAMVLCGPETKDYLINYARSLIYTTALGFPFLASIRTAYELLSTGETESVRYPQPVRGDREFFIYSSIKPVASAAPATDSTSPYPPTQPSDKPVGSI